MHGNVYRLADGVGAVVAVIEHGGDVGLAGLGDGEGEHQVAFRAGVVHRMEGDGDGAVRGARQADVAGAFAFVRGNRELRGGGDPRRLIVGGDRDGKGLGGIDGAAAGDADGERAALVAGGGLGLGLGVGEGDGADGNRLAVEDTAGWKSGVRQGPVVRGYGGVGQLEGHDADAGRKVARLDPVGESERPRRDAREGGVVVGGVRKAGEDKVRVPRRGRDAIVQIDFECDCLAGAELACAWSRNTVYFDGEGGARRHRRHGDD